MGRRWGYVAGALAMVISACTSTVAGTALVASGGGAPSSTPAAVETVAGGLLGDPVTLDPCSLTDPGEFRAYGAVRWGLLDSLDDCVVDIVTSAGRVATIRVGALDQVIRYPDLATKPTREIPGGLKVVEYSSGATSCEQVLVFTDQVTLSVSASIPEGTEPRLCDMVKAGTARAVKTIQDRGVRHRSFPAGSLGLLDPCVVVPSQAVGKVPGLRGVAKSGWPAKHSCYWARSADIQLRVNFIVGEPIIAGGSDKAVQIDGRPTVIYQTNGKDGHAYCSAQTDYIPFTEKNQTGLVEATNLFVRMPGGQMDAACQAAEDAAAVIWPKLPKA